MQHSISHDDSAADILAADSFESERRAYYEELLDEAKRDLLALQLEGAERELARRVGGGRWAAALGLPLSLASVVAVMLYSSSRERRLRAAALICRSVARAIQEGHAA